MFEFSTRKLGLLVALATVMPLATESLEADQIGQTVTSPNNLGSFSTPVSGGTLNTVKIRNDAGPSIGSLAQPGRSSIANPHSVRIGNALGDGAGIRNPLSVHPYHQPGATPPQFDGRLERPPKSAYAALGTGPYSWYSFSSSSPGSYHGDVSGEMLARLVAGFERSPAIWTKFGPVLLANWSGYGPHVGVSSLLSAEVLTEPPASKYVTPFYRRQPSLNLRGPGTIPSVVMPKTGTALQNQFGMLGSTRKFVAEGASTTAPAVIESEKKRPRVPVTRVQPASLKPIGALLSSVADPLSAGRYLQMGEHLFAEGEYIQANNAFRTASNIERKNLLVTHLARVHGLVAAAQYRQAAVALMKSRVLDPQLSLIKQIKLREFYGDPADLEDHLASMRRYYLTHSGSPDVVALYGYMLLVSDRASEARKVLGGGAAANPEDSMIASLLSIAKQ